MNAEEKRLRGHAIRACILLDRMEREPARRDVPLVEEDLGHLDAGYAPKLESLGVPALRARLEAVRARIAREDAR